MENSQPKNSNLLSCKINIIFSNVKDYSFFKKRLGHNFADYSKTVYILVNQIFSFL